MSSWFANSAEALRSQIEQIGKSAEQVTLDDGQALGAFLEQSQAAFRASADRAAESFAQAHRLATQTDEGLQSVRGSILASVGAAWPLQQRIAPSEFSAEELLNRYNTEVKALESNTVNSPGSGCSDALDDTATLAAQTLSDWNQRLECDAEDGASELAAPGHRCLLRSSGLKTALEVLSSRGCRRKPLLSRAAAVAAAEKRIVEDDSAIASSSSSARASGSTRLSSQAAEQPDEAAGGQLARILMRASQAPPSLVAELLETLAEAVEVADRCRNTPDSAAAEEDVSWVRNIILATLADSREADAHAAKRLNVALQKVLASSNSPKHSALGTQIRTAPFSGGGRPTIGSEVWACWPGDGSWYRARVKGFSERDRVKVDWLQLPTGGVFEASEYVANSDYSGETDFGNVFSELSNTSVMRVDATIRRPPQIPTNEMPPDSQWAAAVAFAEDRNQLFRKLWRLRKQLDFHKDWKEPNGSVCSIADGVETKETLWRYSPEDGFHLDIRVVPMITGPRTGLALLAGEVFRVSQEHQGSDGVLYLKLADGRGWVFDKKDGVGSLCERCEGFKDATVDNDEEDRIQILSDSEQPFLSGAAETLAAMRAEVEEKAEALVCVASETEGDLQTVEDQIETSTSAMRSELEALQSKREEVRVRTDGLCKQREELLSQLRKVEEELQAAEKEHSELDSREKQLNESMERVSSELSGERDRAKVLGLVMESRGRLLARSVQAAKSVEEQISKRAASAAEAAEESGNLASQEQLVGVTALDCDHSRCTELHELVASWHEAVWGPTSGALAKNHAAATTLRDLHVKALDVVEDARLEAEEIATASGIGSSFEGLLGLTASGASDEKTAIARQISRSATAYKEMHAQLCENLQRLGDLECIALGVMPSPPSPPRSELQSPEKLLARTGIFLEAFGLPASQGGPTPGFESNEVELEAEAAFFKRRSVDGGI
eukprot:TRINITY_DN15227_c2_g1_i1.p1 TRINITY_DN15227_c2_g1~~TRINITY_DN15227_c2_g1_i1.p1  ORF type:complete len:955 (-),score=222.57 TRINITY_DN15227_c2_g1_i1:63-2927(-)